MIQKESATEREGRRAYRQCGALITDYGFQLEDRVFTPNGSAVSPAENAARNKAIEVHELEAWQTKPDLFAVFVSDKTEITTWLGSLLGCITSSSTHVNRGARICCIKVRGNNGANYWGRYSSDWSQLVLLHKSR